MREHETAKKSDIDRIENWLKTLTWLVVFGLVFIGLVKAADISSRPDIRPLKDSTIVRIVRGYAGFHTGVDYACFVDTPVYATADGIIVKSRYENGYGNTIVVKHEWVQNGKPITVYSLYGHLQEFKRLVGERVYKGQLIGLSGSTGRSEGYHLHYSLMDANMSYIFNGTYQRERKIEEGIIK